MSGCWFLALEAGWWHGRSSSSAGTARAAAAASADDSTSSGSCSCSCLRPSLLWCFPVRDPRFCSSQQAASTIYSLKFSRMYSLGFSRISEDTLGTFLLRFCAIFGTKLGGVLLFRASFEKDVWLLVSRLGGWLMARQEQQQRRNSKSSSSISGRQHQQRQLQLQLPPYFTAILRHFWHEIRWCFAVWFLALEAGWWHGRSSSSAGTARAAAAAASADDSTSSCSCSCLRPSLLWCFPVRDPRFCSSQQAASTIYSLRFSRLYSLGFSRISEDTLGTFLLRFCAIFGTKLGGVLLFRVSFEKDVWLLVSRLGGWLMARQEQQQRRNSKSSSSSISGRQHHCDFAPFLARN